MYSKPKNTSSILVNQKGQVKNKDKSRFQRSAGSAWDLLNKISGFDNEIIHPKKLIRMNTTNNWKLSNGTSGRTKTATSPSVQFGANFKHPSQYSNQFLNLTPIKEVENSPLGGWTNSRKFEREMSNYCDCPPCLRHLPSYCQIKDQKLDFVTMRQISAPQ